MAFGHDELGPGYPPQMRWRWAKPDKRCDSAAKCLDGLKGQYGHNPPPRDRLTPRQFPHFTEGEAHQPHRHDAGHAGAQLRIRRNRGQLTKAQPDDRRQAHQQRANRTASQAPTGHPERPEANQHGANADGDGRQERKYVARPEAGRDQDRRCRHPGYRRLPTILEPGYQIRPRGECDGQSNDELKRQIIQTDSGAVSFKGLCPSARDRALGAKSMCSLRGSAISRAREGGSAPRSPPGRKSVKHRGG
jgi:hypothetical protein